MCVRIYACMSVWEGSRLVAYFSEVLSQRCYFTPMHLQMNAVKKNDVSAHGRSPNCLVGHNMIR